MCGADLGQHLRQGRLVQQFVVTVKVDDVISSNPRIATVTSFVCAPVFLMEIANSGIVEPVYDFPCVIG